MEMVVEVGRSESTGLTNRPLKQSRRRQGKRRECLADGTPCQFRWSVSLSWCVCVCVLLFTSIFHERRCFKSLFLSLF